MTAEHPVVARELAGRSAIVTGASRNIGRAIAVALGTGGASVLVHAHRDADGAEETAAMVRDAGGAAQVMLGDLTEPQMATHLVQAACEAFGGLDIAVANAAVRPEARFDDLDLAQWRSVMALCVDSVFLLASAAAPRLRQSSAGTIVTLGGLTGHAGAGNRAHVITAKAAVAGLTKALAHDLGADGITVNCVSPGLIATARAGSSPHHHASRTNVLGHRGTPEDVAAAVRMLCGPSARYITGQTLHVNGGALMV
jgi:3-oxoacyl-[acyl-carrier protein] reductase